LAHSLDSGEANAKVRDRPLYVQQGNLVTGRTVAPGGYGRFLIDIDPCPCGSGRKWKRCHRPRPATGQLLSLRCLAAAIMTYFLNGCRIVTQDLLA
jgi:SEC-C motif